MRRWVQQCCPSVSLPSLLNEAAGTTAAPSLTARCQPAGRSCVWPPLQPTRHLRQPLTLNLLLISFAARRQLALAKQDVHAGVLSALMGLAWFITVVWNGGRVRLLLSNLALQRPLFFCAACLLPPLLVRRWGLLWWAR